MAVSCDAKLFESGVQVGEPEANGFSANFVKRQKSLLDVVINRPGAQSQVGCSFALIK